MSIESQALVWAHSRATGSTLLALLAIADHDGDGGAWPSMETIARRARVSRDAARKLVRRLEELGEVSTDTNGGGGLRTASHMRTNRYEITLECPPSCDHSFRHRERVEPVDKTPQPNGGEPAKRRGAPQPDGGTKHPINTPLTSSSSRSEVMGANDRDSDSQQKDPYAHLSPGEKQQQARQRMINDRQRETPRQRYTAPPAPVIPRYDPRTEPQKPEPLSAEQRAANALAVTYRCTQGIAPRFTHAMLIATGEGCAHCGSSTAEILAENQETP